MMYSIFSRGRPAIQGVYINYNLPGWQNNTGWHYLASDGLKEDSYGNDSVHYADSFDTGHLSLGYHWISYSLMETVAYNGTGVIWGQL